MGTMASTADNSAQKVVTEEQAGNRGLPVEMWAVTEVATTETDDGVHTTAETSQLRAAASASEDSVLINEDSEDLFSRRQRGIHRRKSFFQREAKTDIELRKILNIKRKGDIQEGAAVFIQRFARNAREDRFRVSAADCIRVSSEVGARRQGVHHLFKYVHREALHPRAAATSPPHPHAAASAPPTLIITSSIILLLSSGQVSHVHDAIHCHAGAAKRSVTRAFGGVRAARPVRER